MPPTSGMKPMLKVLLLIAFVLSNSTSLAATSSPETSGVKVGAWGDDASRGNLGVEARIETHSYDSYPTVLDYFWVGDFLSDDAFIQFGYSLQIGTQCLRGDSIAGKFSCLGTSQIIFGSDARWEWQYWPNRYGTDFYYEIGPEASAGANATWHEYAIEPGPTKAWEFTFDGQVVAISNFTASRSSDPVLVVAERSPIANVTSNLGPVAFSELGYFNGDGWKQSKSLVALNTCETSNACSTNLYGSIASGMDSVIAGSNVPTSDDGTLLWTNAYARLGVTAHPDVQFYVTTTSGTRSYNGSAIIDVPEGMLAYVSILEPTTGTTGILGLLGAQDHFQGWVGSVNSQNLTVHLLMDSDKAINAVWTTDATIPFIVFGLLVIVVTVTVAFELLKMSHRDRRPVLVRNIRLGHSSLNSNTEGDTA